MGLPFFLYGQIIFQLSVNPEDRDICDSLRRKFEVTGVPRLVLISTNGDIIVNNARNADFFSLDVSKETVSNLFTI